MVCFSAETSLLYSRHLRRFGLSIRLGGIMCTIGTTAVLGKVDKVVATIASGACDSVRESFQITATDDPLGPRKGVGRRDTLTLNILTVPATLTLLPHTPVRASGVPREASAHHARIIPRVPRGRCNGTLP